MFKKAFLFFFIVFDLCALQLNVYNVGHGVFSICTVANKALIIDCGNNNTCVKPTKEAINLLKTMQSINVIISHPHVDHYSFMQYLFDNSPDGKILYQKLDQIYIGYSITNMAIECNLSLILQNSKTIQLNNKTSKIDLKKLKHFFGSYTTIDALLPNNIFKYEKPHDMNIAVVINNGKQKMLFPGDAEDSLLPYILYGNNRQYNDENFKLLENVTFLLANHHGSGSSSGHLYQTIYLKLQIIFCCNIKELRTC